MAAPEHIPVLLEEVVEHLDVRAGGHYLDATVGLGGHARAILEASAPGGRLLGLDRDPQALRRAADRLEGFGDRVTLRQSSFSDAAEQVREHGFHPLDGALADVGVSSLQLDDPDRGFSLRLDGPLDMRMGPEVGPTAQQWLAGVDRIELARVLREYGEVGRARAQAAAILNARDAGELNTTKDLARVVEKVEGRPRIGQAHPATRTFQALRIAVNRELEELQALLTALPDLVRPGGRVAIISFHSLEDRMVKQALSDPTVPAELRHLPIGPVLGPWKARKRPLMASERELAANPRARSARLRVAERREMN